MITAHLPAGYLLGRTAPSKPGVIAAALIGSAVPDFDLIWFYFIDDRAFHHHRYWVHAPMFWAIIAAVTLPIIARLRPKWFVPGAVFFAAILLHLLLDSISGDIMWLWPWSDALYALFTIPARFDQWILNFVLHPVFLLEVLIWVACGWLYFRKSTL